jgi:ABC-type phosphate transport system substrate-binding protein
MSTKQIHRAVAVLGLTVLALALPAASQAQISVVVAAGSSRTADRDAVARMFSGQVTSWSDGSKVQIVDQASTEAGKQFYSTVLSRSPAQVRKALTALLLSGQIPKPEQGASDAEVKAAVARLTGAIGYISSASLDGTVKELVRIQ